MLRSLVLVSLTFCAAACDPAFPTASGRVTLASGIEANGCLHVALFEPDGTTFGIATASRLEDQVTSQSFPYAYQTVASIGVSKADLNAVAWFAKTCSGERPEAGDVYGITAFRAHSCGASCGIGKECSCGETTGVDITIDSTVP